MSFLQRFFKTKNNTEPTTAVVAQPPTNQVQRVSNTGTVVAHPWRLQQIMSALEGLVHPSTVGNNFIELFKTIPEVFWPIDYIARRISEAHFDLKRTSDDSIVWCNRMGADRILKQPNPLMTFRELVYTYWVYKLTTGNTFFRAAMAGTVAPDAVKFRWCDNFWVLPSPLVEVKPVVHSYGTPIFGIAKIDELIKGYSFSLDGYDGLTIPYWQVLHDRDGIPELTKGIGFLKANSRLLSVKKNIANLIAVYEARNVIYIKRGALGFIVARKEDEAGTVALEPEEKKDIEEKVANQHGVREGVSPWVVTDIPIDFIRTNLSIADLQPFEETLEDAIKIAGVYGIPSVLVPRKDQSTFNNQDAAEKSVYTSVIIPSTKRFCEALTSFLGLEESGLYLDCDFSDVACLQVGMKEQEEVRKRVNDRCLLQFNNGLITINDWRSQIHESAFDGEIFNKTKFQMTPEELEQVERIIKPSGKQTENNESNSPNNNNKPSKNEDYE